MNNSISNTKIYGLCLLLMLVVFSCKDEDTAEETIDLTYNYFPVQVGSEWVYHVDSFAYDDNTGVTTIDTFSYQYKEVIGQILNGSIEKNDAELLVNRFYKYGNDSFWTAVNSNRIIKTNAKLEYIDENIHYIRMLFPLALNKTWNGNMANTKEDEEYKVTAFDEPYKTYPKTCRIEQCREKNIIEEIVREEIYARETGLVYRLSDSLNTQVKSGKEVTRGFRYRLKLVSYKK